MALAAQGFAAPRRHDGRAIRRLFERVALVQIDSVNVLSRAHYLPGFARLGAYDREALDRAAHYAPRRLFEYWGHEASLIDVELQPLLRWRMARAHDDAWGGMRRVGREKPELLQEVLERVRDEGPLAARDLIDERPQRRARGGTGTDRRRRSRCCSGAARSPRRGGATSSASTTCPSACSRGPCSTPPTPDEADAQRELVAIAARALGVAALPELRDYFRLPADAIRPRVAELVEAGELLPVEVEGWDVPAWLHRDARIPRRVDARALLGPFDNLLWERGRVERLFGFRFKLEIYVPRPKRVYGYYVLPFLLGDRLVARVDLKADRQAGRLLAHAVHPEPDAPPETEAALAEELALLAGWLGLTPSGS